MENKQKNQWVSYKRNSWLTILSLVVFILLGIYVLWLTVSDWVQINENIDFNVQSNTVCRDSNDCESFETCIQYSWTEHGYCSQSACSNTVEWDASNDTCQDDSTCNTHYSCTTVVDSTDLDNCTTNNACVCINKWTCEASDFPLFEICETDNDCTGTKTCSWGIVWDCCTAKTCVEPWWPTDYCEIRHNFPDTAPSAWFQYIEQYREIGELTYAWEQLEYSCCFDYAWDTCISMDPHLLTQWTNNLSCLNQTNNASCFVDFEIPYKACDTNWECLWNEYCTQEWYCRVPSCDNWYIEGDEVCDQWQNTWDFPVQRCENCQTYRWDPITCEWDMGMRDWLEVLFILDASDTMQVWITPSWATNRECSDWACKFIDAQDAISSFAQSLDSSKDKVWLITFSDCAEVVYWLWWVWDGKICDNTYDTSYSLTWDGSLSQEFYSWLYNAELWEFTDMWWALKLAAEHISNNHDNSKETIVIFLWDWEPTIGDWLSQVNSSLHYTFAQNQAQELQNQFPDMNIYSVWYDIDIGSQAEEIMKNDIASDPANYTLSQIEANVNTLTEVFTYLWARLIWSYYWW